MNRSEMREQAFLLLFEKEFFKDLSCEDIEEIFDENVAPISEYGKSAFENTVLHMAELDDIITKYLKGWKLQRLPKVNLSILRLALYEIIYEENVPSSASVNEAVELAKKYSGKDDGSFVNGVLRSYLRDSE
ncbi:MAG TPA: transcription antitermination factor NusB [Candidatus Eubacterium faecavium]|nr:transcription antitermination factor NusB [Candidatus Eubacterium faecavium]